MEYLPTFICHTFKPNVGKYSIHGAYWIALGWYTRYFLSKTAIEVRGSSIPPYIRLRHSVILKPMTPCHERWYIFLHEWLIFYGKRREIHQSHGCYVMGCFFLKSHLHVHRFEVENWQLKKLESFPLIFLDDITDLHHLIFQTGTKNPEIILLLINN